MRILYITDALAIWGGLERILVDKANYLAEHYGYQVSIITSEQGSRPVPYALSPKVAHIDLGVNFYQKYRHKGLVRLFAGIKKHDEYRYGLMKQISEFRPDVIVVMRIDLLGDVIKVKRNTPLIFESHSSCNIYIFEDFKLHNRLQYLRFVKKACETDVVVALTKGDASDWENKGCHVACIPNLVNLNTLRVYSRQDSKSAIYVGRFAKQKDLDSLIQIWAIVNEKHPDWTLNLYGEGDGESSLQKTVSEKKINIIIHRPTSQIHNRYIESSFLLMTSIFEPFGLVLPEAMSCGLPVVAFDCPYGPAEIITDGKDGFLIKKRDINEFALRVSQLIEDCNLRVKMGKEAIKTAQRFHKNLIMPKWKSLFEEISKVSK